MDILRVKRTLNLEAGGTLCLKGLNGTSKTSVFLISKLRLFIYVATVVLTCRLSVSMVD